MSVKRLTRTKPRRKDDFMAACKGYTAYQTAVALSDLTPGVDWRRCSKGFMADEWVRGASYVSSRTDLGTVTVAALGLMLRFPRNSVIATAHKISQATRLSMKNPIDKGIIITEVVKTLGLVTREHVAYCLRNF